MYYYVGKHEDATSVYDGIIAEILSEKIARTQKFLRTHYVRSDGHSIRKDAKKSYFRRCDREWELDDRRPNYRKCGEGTIRRMRTELAESVSRSDYDAELMPGTEYYVGETTLSKRMNRAYQQMQKIAHDFCDQNGYTWGQMWAYDPNDHYYHVDYPDEYYRVRNEYIALRDECNERFINKMQKSGCI